MRSGPHGHAESAERARRVILERAAGADGVGLICGTGFAPCTDVLSDRVTVPFDESLGFRPERDPRPHQRGRRRRARDRGGGGRQGKGPAL